MQNKIKNISDSTKFLIRHRILIPFSNNHLLMIVTLYRYMLRQRFVSLMKKTNSLTQTTDILPRPLNTFMKVY